MTAVATRAVATETVLAKVSFRPRRPGRPRLPRRAATPSTASAQAPSAAAAATAGLTAAVAGIGLTATLDGPAGWSLVGCVAAATVLVTAAGLVGTRRSSRAGIVAAGGLAVAGGLALLARPSLGHGWFGGAWLDLAAGPLPLSASPRLVLALAGLGWVAGGLATVAGLLRVRLLALLPTVVLMVLGSLLGTATGRQGCLVAAAVAVHLVLARRPSPRRLPLAAVVLVCCLAAGLAIPGTGQPRTLSASSPTLDVTGTSPLAWVAAWQGDIDTAAEVFSISGDAGSTPLRWASLDTYDGVTWTSSATFTLTGPRPSADGGQRLAADKHDVTISRLALPGPWLPTPGRALAVSCAELLFDSATGDLAAASPPASYRVSGAALAAEPAQLQAAHQQHRSGSSLLAGVEVPTAVATIAEQATAGTTTDHDRLAALASWTQQNVRYNRSAVPGQSIRTIAEALTGGRDATMDQIVSGYALMARELGYPSRVVVGFTTGEHRSTVSSSDIVAWPEVYLDGLGWQPFYPVPLAGVADSYDDVVRQQLTPVAPGPSETPVQPKKPSDPQASRATVEQPGAGSRWPLLGLAGAMLVALGALPVFRRRRRYRGSPAQQVLRAWRGVQRSLVRGDEAGALTAEEVLQRVQADRPPETVAAARDISQLVTALVYGGATASAQDARRAWRSADIIRRRRRGGRR